LKGIALLLVGYAIGARVVIVFDRLYEGGWRGGFAILWLSAPTTVAYLAVILAIRYWRLLSPSVLALALCGFLAAVYPILFGFFPVYYYRLEFAISVIAL